jgi:hypothetical protein
MLLSDAAGLVLAGRQPGLAPWRASCSGGGCHAASVPLVMKMPLPPRTLCFGRKRMTRLAAGWRTRQDSRRAMGRTWQAEDHPATTLRAKDAAGSNFLRDVEDVAAAQAAARHGADFHPGAEAHWLVLKAEVACMQEASCEEAAGPPGRGAQAIRRALLRTAPPHIEENGSRGPHLLLVVPWEVETVPQWRMRPRDPQAALVRRRRPALVHPRAPLHGCCTRGKLPWALCGGPTARGCGQLAADTRWVPVLTPLAGW